MYKLRNLLFLASYALCFLSFSQVMTHAYKQIDSINAMASNAYEKGNLIRSINELNKAIAIADIIDSERSYALTNYTLGQIYRFNDQFKEAVRCYHNMLEAGMRIDDQSLMTDATLMIAALQPTDAIEERMSLYTSALTSLQDTTNVTFKDSDKRTTALFQIWLHLAMTQLDAQRPDDAFISVMRAEELSDGSSFTQGRIAQVYGSYFIQKKSYYKAHEKFEEAIALFDNVKNKSHLTINAAIGAVYSDYALSYSRLGKHKEAEYKLMLHQDYIERVAIEKRVRHERLEKSKTYLLNYVQNAELINRKKAHQEQVLLTMKMINGIIGCLIVLIVIACMVLYKGYRAKKKVIQILNFKTETIEVAQDWSTISSVLR